ncbi:MAG TPA: EthD domain-containing protein [Sphingobium sp.]|nr:EthD domain-containing protein [Sphingobium sp.]
MKIIAMFKRKPGLTPEQFREYYETRHAVLGVKLMPFFKDYRRNYIRHDLGPQRSSAEPNSASLDFDVITEISFANREDYERMLQALSDPVIREQIVEDEKQFMDRGATLSYVVDESVSVLG